MSTSRRFGLRPSIAVLSLLTALTTLFLWPITYQPPGHVLHHPVRVSTSQKRDSKIGVPFGRHSYTHNFTATNRSSTLRKRAVDYDRLVCKGRKLLNMIQTGQPLDYHWDEAALRNGWTWKRNVLGAPPEELYKPLAKLGVPTDAPSVHSIYLRQDQVFMDAFGNLNNPPTNGLYYNTFSPTHGTIIAESNFSPSFKRPNSPTPPLTRWSDIIWLLWTHEAGILNIRNLCYIFRANIITPQTRDLIEYIEVAHQDDLHLPWPGHTYDMDSEDGLALLATAHGQGVAYLVGDHSDVLGRKVPMARVFTELPGGETDDEGSSDGGAREPVSDEATMDVDGGGPLGSDGARGEMGGNGAGPLTNEGAMGGGNDEGALQSDDARSDGGESWNWNDATYYYILWELRDSITG